MLTGTYSTGVCGSVAVLDALIKRAEEGGSYKVDVSVFMERLSWNPSNYSHD